MNVDEGNKCAVSKGEFLEAFRDLYHALKDYETLLNAVNAGQTSQQQLLPLLNERINHMKFDGLNVRAMEMIGAYLKSTLEHFQGDKLNFFLPPEPPDDFFKTNDALAGVSERIEETEKELHEIQEKVYYITRLLPPRNIDKLRLILKEIAGLFKSIIRKDFDDIEGRLNHLHHMTANKESFFLLNEIGRMVRGIHDSLQDFSAGVVTDDGLDASLMDDMPDAVDKLNLVIQRMEDAANSTMDQADLLLDSNAKNQASNTKMLSACSDIEAKLAALAQSHPELADSLNGITKQIHAEIKEPLVEEEKALASNEGVFFEIINSQSFQDLTGQTLKKIIAFIEQLEINLLNILQKYGGTSRSGAPQQAHHVAPTGEEIEELSPLVGVERDGVVLHGPADNKGKSAAQKQNDIDKMLAGFGF